MKSESNNCPACAKPFRFAVAMAFVLVFGLTLTIHCTVPAFGLPAPGRLPPLFPSVLPFLESQCVFGASFFIIETGTAKDNSLAFSRVNFPKLDNERVKVSTLPIANYITVNLAGGNDARLPISSDLRHVERGEAELFRIAAKPDSDLRDLKRATSGMDFAIEVNTTRQLGNYAREIDSISPACPKRCAIPVSPASIELFGSIHARDTLALPVAQKGHFAFVHGVNVALDNRLSNA